MKTIIALVTLLLVGCNSFTISGQYADYSIDKDRNIKVAPKIFYAK
jgi:hypothetical protein